MADTSTDTVQPDQKTHAWQPEWRFWERIQTALLAMVPFLDDADNLLRSEIADLNAVLPSLRNPAHPEPLDTFQLAREMVSDPDAPLANVSYDTMEAWILRALNRLKGDEK